MYYALCCYFKTLLLLCIPERYLSGLKPLFSWFLTAILRQVHSTAHCWHTLLHWLSFDQTVVKYQPKVLVAYTNRNINVFFSFHLSRCELVLVAFTGTDWAPRQNLIKGGTKPQRNPNYEAITSELFQFLSKTQFIKTQTRIRIIWWPWWPPLHQGQLR